MKVRIAYSDGRYSLTPVDQQDPDPDDCDVINISEAMWRDYDTFLELEAEWHALLQKIDNETYDERERCWAEFHRRHLEMP